MGATRPASRSNWTVHVRHPAERRLKTQMSHQPRQLTSNWRRCIGSTPALHNCIKVAPNKVRSLIRRDISLTSPDACRDRLFDAAKQSNAGILSKIDIAFELLATER